MLPKYALNEYTLQMRLARTHNYAWATCATYIPQKYDLQARRISTDRKYVQNQQSARTVCMRSDYGHKYVRQV